MKGVINHFKETGWVVIYHQKHWEEETVEHRLPLLRASIDRAKVLYKGLTVDFDEVLVSPIGRKLNLQDVNQNRSGAKWYAELRLDENLNPINIDWEKEMRKCKESPYYFYTNYILIDGKPATTRLSEENFNTLALGNFRKYSED